MMAVGRPIQVTIGDIDLLVETVPVVGNESTSGRPDKVIQRATDAFTRAQETIVEIAKSTTQMIENAAASAARPDGLEIEFGLKFSASGNIIMAGATGEATLRITLIYGAKPQSTDRDAEGGSPEAAT